MEESLLLPSELLEVLRFSLKATAFPVDVLRDEPTFDPRNPAFRKLVEAVLFSRRFGLTYYVSVLAVVGIFSCLHWGRKASRWRRRSRGEITSRLTGSETPASTSSSRSSTLQGTESPPAKDIAERTPLLGGGELYNEVDRLPWRFYSRLQAWLNSQPDPIPAITSPLNHLPTNATTLITLVFLAVNVFYLFYKTPLSVPMLFAFADRAGLCFVTNLPILYVLAAKTNQPLKFLTGWSYEGLNLFHRRLGEWMTVLAALHGAGMLGVWYTLLRPFHFTLLHFLSSRLVLLGIFALVAYLAIYVTSIGWVRWLYYETFLGLHIVLQVTALVFLFFHHPNCRPYVLVSLGIWTLDRIVTRTIISCVRLVATLQIADDAQTVLLFCDVPLSKSSIGLKKSIAQGWEAGQHVFVTVPGLGWRHRLQSHPFTIASPAPAASLREGTWPLQLTIRAQDGFSKELLTYTKFHQHAEVRLDGPYGSTDVLDALRHADRACLIAGGSGIAVTYPLTWQMNTGATDNMILSSRTVYKGGVKVVPSIVAWENLPDSNECTHIWVRQDHRHDSWLTMFPRINQSMAVTRGDAAAPTEGSIGANLVSRKFETRDLTGTRPDMKVELRRWAEDESPLLTAAVHNLRMWRKLVVVVSGPDGLVRDVRNGVASLLRAGYNVEVYVEKFGW